MGVGLLLGSQFSRRHTCHRYVSDASLTKAGCRNGRTRRALGRGRARASRTSTHSRNSGNRSPSEASAVCSSKQAIKPTSSGSEGGAVTVFHRMSILSCRPHRGCTAAHGKLEVVVTDSVEIPIEIPIEMPMSACMK